MADELRPLIEILDEAISRVRLMDNNGIISSEAANAIYSHLDSAYAVYLNSVSI